ncbi:c-type cytochrome [Balneola vulgaris]|uniref:c-type cytochrome n=1 Tax=Balneola vulgaris TaxID=287535 RepID=UPI0003748545|nr:cytochrome c [Balneola vulgaris]
MKKGLKIISGVLIAFLLLVGIGLTYISTALPNAGEAPEMNIELTQERIERGRHLANNVMACMYCHTPHDTKKFTNPLDSTKFGAGGVEFGKAELLPGTYYSTNITPAELGSWTDGEIFHSITTGVSKDGRALFPIMPYENYAKMDEEDIKAVIAYLRTLEPIESTVPESTSDFPMNFIINTIPKPANFTERPSPSNKIAYGKYLVNAASCNDCHTPRNKGAFIEELTLAGSSPFTLKTGGTVRTANITPDESTGIGAWTEEAFIKRFKSHNDSTFQHYPIQEGEYNTVMPWMNYSKMSEEELSAIYAYLRSIKPVKNLVTRFTPPNGE